VERFVKFVEIGGAVASISSWYIAIYYQWHGTSSAQRNLALATGAFFLAVVVFARFKLRQAKERGIDIQSGSIDLTHRQDKQYEVFYPRRFASTPNLTLRAASGSVELTVIEERPDGFRFQKGSSAYRVGRGLTIAWVARGVLPR